MVGRRPRVTAAAVVPAAVLTILLVSCGGGGDKDEDAESTSIGEGVTEQEVLPPFEPSDDAGEKPDLPRVIAFAQGNSNETELALIEGLKLGAADADLEFIQANAESDPATQVENVNQFLVRGIGALVSPPTDPAAQADVILTAMERGVAALNLVFGPATSQVNASQYAVGETIGRIAAEYIESELGGEAKVVLLNQDDLPPIQARFEAVRTVLADIPGAEIVADLTPDAPDPESGAETMNTLLQKFPEIDVVIAPDGVLTGALSAFEAADRASDDLFLGGMDGTASVLDAIREGGPVKATVGLSPAVFAYGWSQYAADWLDGKAIPQAVNVIPAAIASPDDVIAYQEDQDDPAAVWSDPERRAKYLEMFGSISYETREDYLAYNWSIPE